VGLRAQQRALETIAGNISNINTPAFKRSNLRFSELVAAPPADAAGAGSGANFASIAGVGAWAQPMVNQQGALQSTGDGLDLAIDGKGFIELVDRRAKRTRLAG
jgi:flagellar basal-body rod protein FlgG